MHLEQISENKIGENKGLMLRNCEGNNTNNATKQILLQMALNAWFIYAFKIASRITT